MEGRATRDREENHEVALGQAPDTPATAVGTLDRAVEVLNAVEAGARSYTDITRTTGLSRPTAHRLIRALEQHGFLLRAGGGEYALGPRLLSLASSAMRELPLRDIAHPALERLARSTGESAQLFVRDDDVRICVDSVESESELRTIVDVGATLPLTKGSAGKVLLAWAGEHDRRRILASLPSDEAKRLERAIATTVRRGWADSIGEREPGVASVSVPVFDAMGALVAAISVSGPANRIGALHGRRSAPAVIEAARQVEATLGVAST